LGKFFRNIKTLRLDYVVTSNRFHIPWQILGSTFRDFSITNETTPVDLLFGDRFNPSLHDFRGGFFKSEMQKHKLFTSLSLVMGVLKSLPAGRVWPTASSWAAWPSHYRLKSPSWPGLLQQVVMLFRVAMSPSPSSSSFSP